MEYSFGSQIKTMAYCEDMDLISLGMKDGRIHNYLLSIEVDKDAEPNEESSEDE